MGAETITSVNVVSVKLSGRDRSGRTLSHYRPQRRVPHSG
ncbi:hypothetical protein ABH926_009922 [Catenulispora sp. GP43]